MERGGEGRGRKGGRVKGPHDSSSQRGNENGGGLITGQQLIVTRAPEALARWGDSRLIPDLLPDHHFHLRSPAVEVRCLLPVELAANRATVLSGTEPLEAIVDELGVLLVEVLVRHDVRSAGVHFATAHLQNGERVVKKKV